MDAKRIAMWSGPRNISTAMMRSFGSRSDTTVMDEPLYARYLNANPDQNHPARNEIIAKGPLKLDEITASLTGPPPQGTTISYQKHMAHHLLPTDFDTPNRLDWIDALHNCLLIRDPADMITSFIKVIPNPTPTDLGLPQQVRLFNHLRNRQGQAPIVLDSKDVLCNPRGMLEALCDRVGIAFDQAMLTWQPGPRQTDGVWAPHWYASVYQSTGFAPYHAKNEPVPTNLASVHKQCQSLYDTLHKHRLQP
jgi:Sulfotransferase domain